MLASNQNKSVRGLVANSLRPLVEYRQATRDSSVREWTLFRIAWRSLRALIKALDDEEYYVRFEAARTLIGARCLESFRPIVELWLEKDIDAFPSNIMQHLQQLADHDENAQRELRQVLVDLHAGGTNFGIRRLRQPDQADE